MAIHSTAITTDLAPIPNGHYSQAQLCGNTLFLSVQLPINPESPGTEDMGDPVGQSLQVLKNLENIVKEAGGSRNSIMRLTFYVTDIAHWGAVNDACRQFFDAHKPARGIVCVQALHKGYLVASDAIACV